MADTLDLLTLDEAKRAAGIDPTDDRHDDALAQYNTAVARLLDSRIGPTVRRTITGEEHDDICGHTILVLRHRPVTSITALTEYDGDTGTLLTAATLGSWPDDGYRLRPYDPTPGLYDGRVVRMAGDRPSWWRGPVAVTYVAGRVASTTTVDEIHKRAASICLENLWRDRQQTAGQFGEYDVPVASFPTFAMPNAVMDLLRDEIGQDEPWGIA